jgi:hypothetical protein
MIHAPQASLSQPAGRTKPVRFVQSHRFWLNSSDEKEHRINATPLRENYHISLWKSPLTGFISQTTKNGYESIRQSWTGIMHNDVMDVK